MDQIIDGLELHCAYYSSLHRQHRPPFSERQRAHSANNFKRFSGSVPPDRALSLDRNRKIISSNYDPGSRISKTRPVRKHVSPTYERQIGWPSPPSPISPASPTPPTSLSRAENAISLSPNTGGRRVGSVSPPLSPPDTDIVLIQQSVPVLSMGLSEGVRRPSLYSLSSDASSSTFVPQIMQGSSNSDLGSVENEIDDQICQTLLEEEIDLDRYERLLAEKDMIRKDLERLDWNSLIMSDSPPDSEECTYFGGCATTTSDTNSEDQSLSAKSFSVIYTNEKNPEGVKVDYHSGEEPDLESSDCEEIINAVKAESEGITNTVESATHSCIKKTTHSSLQSLTHAQRSTSTPRRAVSAQDIKSKTERERCRSCSSMSEDEHEQLDVGWSKWKSALLDDEEEKTVNNDAETAATYMKRVNSYTEENIPKPLTHIRRNFESLPDMTISSMPNMPTGDSMSDMVQGRVSQDTDLTDGSSWSLFSSRLSTEFLKLRESVTDSVTALSSMNDVTCTENIPTYPSKRPTHARRNSYAGNTGLYKEDVTPPAAMNKSWSIRSLLNLRSGEEPDSNFNTRRRNDSEEATSEYGTSSDIASLSRVSLDRINTDRASLEQLDKTVNVSVRSRAERTLSPGRSVGRTMSVDRTRRMSNIEKSAQSIIARREEEMMQAQREVRKDLDKQRASRRSSWAYQLDNSDDESW